MSNLYDKELLMRRSKMSLALRFLTMAVALPMASPLAVLACSRGGPFSFDELFAADVIVRATAVKYVATPDPNTTTTGTPDSTVEFKIEEVLKGENVPVVIVLNGYLSDRDDYNDVEVPYKFVRPGGRAGSCFANTYKEGAQFLLFLKKTQDGYTPNISALGPTNEQLHGSEDTWLQWVKGRLKAQGGKENKVASTGYDMRSLIEPVLTDLAAAI